MFTRQQVRDHIRHPKAVRSIVFRPASKSRDMPKFLNMKSRRVEHTDLMDAGGNYRALFLWRDGAYFDKRKFSAWLFLSQGEDLIPIARMDYHPSHKGFHVHFNCVDGPNYNGPYPQKQNERFGYRTSIQGKELVIAITARMSVSLGDII